MSIWAIADIHASSTDEYGRPSKPMDVFGSAWRDHVERLEQAWHRHVGDADTVIVAGDIDWGLTVHEAAETLDRLAAWPGHKILLRGNHDYWWSSKATNKVRRHLAPSLSLLHNNAFQVEGYNVCGTKGSAVPGGADWSPEHDKLLHREQQRLQISLDARDPVLPTIVALHYPPFYSAHGTSPYRDMLEEYGVCACIYGHLHGEAGSVAPRGEIGGVHYYFVAGDAVNFMPVLVVQEGRLAAGIAANSRKAALAEEKGEPRVTEEHADELGRLAEQLMSDKRDEVGDETQARELYDVPSESADDLARQQDAHD